MPGKVTFAGRKAKVIGNVGHDTDSNAPARKNGATQGDFAKIHDLAELEEITLQNGMLHLRSTL